MLPHITNRVFWYRNIGTRKAPKLAAAQPVEVECPRGQPALKWGWMRPEGKGLLTQWRTTPVVVDWNADGLNDLIMLGNHILGPAVSYTHLTLPTILLV